MNWKVLVGAGCLAGIGFTMSLFIAGLALQDPHLHEAKIGILVGSAISAVLGCLLLLKFLPRSACLGSDGRSGTGRERRIIVRLPDRVNQRVPMQIVKYPHPALRHKAEPVTALSKDIELLVGGMLELMYKHEGLGLAAPQVAAPVGCWS